ncbi:hypothetical protein PP641_gp020 [Arthrobacter phage SilentRX]|uniref:Uncharacterized protein n=1 Tax=Arthrobacter phage SilentRX TaxID=2836091 RepID=A0A8F3E7I6_9CAUD|nr:hypothetical protein PP641_gp020 [Arthrobacter phage SilentRX]QWY82846.1 hypothetical protein SEA_SILENTRX_20 [Arthrobacter phage SilentRX]
MACGACAEKTKRVTYLHTAKDGTKTTYSSEVEAKAAVARRGGSYKAQ